MGGIHSANQFTLDRNFWGAEFLFDLRTRWLPNLLKLYVFYNSLRVRQKKKNIY